MRNFFKAVLPENRADFFQSLVRMPLLNCRLDGLGRNDLMAGHQSNHITVAYVDEDKLPDVLRAFVSQAVTQGIKAYVAGEAYAML